MKSEKFILSKNWSFDRFIKMTMMSALLTIWTTQAQAQCALACNNLVQVSLDDDCLVTITPDMMLEGQGLPGNCAYSVQVLNTNGSARTLPEVTVADIGKTLQVRVLLGANSCWGLVKIEDKLKPRVNCRPRRMVPCYDTNFDPTVALPLPTVTDNCNVIPSSAITVLSDITKERPCTDSIRARRIVCYQAVDASGNISDVCCDTIDYIRITLKDIKFPKNYDSTLKNRPHLSCDGSWAWGGVWNPLTSRYENQYLVDKNGVLLPGNSWDLNGNGYPDPAETGAPFVPNALNVTGYALGYMVGPSPSGTATVPGCAPNAKVGYDLATGTWRTACDGNGGMQNFRIDTFYRPLQIGNTICKINTTYSDDSINICAHSFKILRKWTVIEWCTGEIKTMYQIIKVIDDKGPIATIPTDPDIYEAPCAPNFTISSIISADPYTCTGSWIAYAPINIFDCSDPSKVTYTVQFALADAAGNPPLNGPYYFLRGATSSVQITSGPDKGKWRLTGLPMGCSWLKYTVTDECGNSTEAFTEIKVVDKTPPVAVCDEFTVASLTNDGTARIFAKTFDDGSHDNCSAVGFEVARMQAGCGQQAQAFGPYVDVCCDDILRQVVDANRDGVIDIKDRGHIQVILKVWDDANGSGIYGDRIVIAGTSNPIRYREDNFNTCMVIVKVEDKLPPVITCPPAVTIECGADTSAAILGKPVYSLLPISTPYFTDNCPLPTMSWRNSGVVDNCGQGVITRTFTAYSAAYRENMTSAEKALNSASCTQIITIRNKNPYQGPKLSSTSPVIWKNLENKPAIAGCLGADTDPSKTGLPDLGETACSQVAYTYEDQVFNFVENVCYKILRKWTVIDWCKFKPNLNPNGQEYPAVPTLGVNMWSYVQTIKVSDESNPIIAPSSNPNKIFNVTGPQCGGVIDELKEVATDCSAVAEAALKWTYLIDLYNDGNITNTPSTNSNNNAIRGTATGTSADAAGTFPVGIHKITWTVEDQCGNQTKKEYTFTVRDDKKPTPYCYGSLVTVVMPVQGFVELWAKDYDKGSTDNCPGKLYFTFNGMKPRTMVVAGVTVPLNQVHFFKGQSSSATEAEYKLGLAQKWDPVACSSSMYFDCGDVEDGAKDIQMSVWDVAGNTDFCVVTIHIQANGTSCSGARIAGNISRSQTEMVNEVQVTLQNTVNSETKLSMTNTQGEFEFFGLNQGNAYKVTPEKDVDPINGVSTLDLVLIQRHILGINKFDAATKYLAGDVNKDNKITATDLVELRKLILGIYAKFPANTSWRFIDKAATIADITNPWNTNSYVNITNFTSSMLNNHFTAIKVGDINSSATFNANGPVETRGIKTLTFNTEDVSFGQNEEVVVNVTSANFNQIVGAQWTLGFDASSLELKSILPGAINLSKENINDAHAQDGKIGFSWNDQKSQTFSKEETLFTLVFKATTNNQLSKSLSITSDITNSEAYTNDLNVMNVKFEFSNRTKEVFVLGQNTPNPFTDKTTIAFNLPQAGTATINIYDLTGKTVRKITNSYPKGQSEVVIKAEDLQATGVLFYELESQGFKSTKKMIYLGK